MKEFMHKLSGVSALAGARAPRTPEGDDREHRTVRSVHHVTSLLLLTSTTAATWFLGLVRMRGRLRGTRRCRLLVHGLCR